MLRREVARPALNLAAALCAPSAVTSLIAAVNQVAAVPNVSLLYLPAILVIAVYSGTAASLLASLIAVVEYDFFLLRPFFTLSIGQASDILAFATFVLVAGATGQLAARARSRAVEAQRLAGESVTLYELGQALTSSSEVAHVLHAVTERITDVLSVSSCAVFVPDGRGGLDLAAESRAGAGRDRGSLATAAWVYRQGTEVGVPGGEGASPQSGRVYLPLRTADRTVGVMEVGARRSGEPLDAAERRLLTTFAAQTALVVARARAEEERRRLTLIEESDRLKSALLSAVSHDLRTPLATIKASTTSLLLADAEWTGEERQEMLQAINDEADRLNRLVGNLLDLSRIEAGALHPVLDWYDVHDLVDAVVPRVRLLVANRPFSVQVDPGLRPVRMDLVRVEELAINLIENAVKHTPAGTPIALRLTGDRETLRIVVQDRGPGVPSEHRSRIFGTFQRGSLHGDRDHGLGLGLAICRGIAEAHGGSIHVEDTPGGGATFVFSLPMPPAVGQVGA